MRFIIIPDSPEVWAAVAILLLAGIGVGVYQWLRPPAATRLLGDGRYQQAWPA